jgi:hypothetical protein
MIILNLDSLSLVRVDKFGEVPRPRSNHSSVIYVKENKDPLMIIYGGSGFSENGDEVCFIYNLNTNIWKKYRTVGVNAGFRSYHTANIIKDYMIIFGGEVNGSITNDLYILCLKTKKW